MNEDKVIEVGESIQVAELAEKLDVNAAQIVSKLMENGVMATINENIDHDTASIIADEFDVEVRSPVKEEPEIKKRKASTEGEIRPPVVAMMGHVDHGKTSLLDAIRGSSVAGKESGGITQHISAYVISHQDRDITFLDTPGHEAFSALRQHGAALTDLAVIVIAADDGIKPQTEEAIKFAKKAGVNMLIAINKIDKEGADSNKIKQQLSDHELVPEEWGGSTVVVELSATKKQGIDKLMDMILLVTDLDELKAEKDVPAEGIIIESHMSTGQGPVATVLVEQGVLKPRAYVSAGDTYGKIRTLTDYQGNNKDSAGPSIPAVVTGFKAVPEFGVQFVEHASEKEAKQYVKTHTKAEGPKQKGPVKSATADDLLQTISKKTKAEELRVIIKADVIGSLQSLKQSAEDLGNDEVSVDVVSSGVGDVTESDVMLASTSKAVILAFHVNATSTVKRLAAREDVKVYVYDVIYELLDDVKNMLTKLLKPEIIEEEKAKLDVKGVFKITKSLAICGGQVTSGKVEPGQLVRLIRDKKDVASAEVAKVQKGQQEVKEVVEGEMCGIELKTNEKVPIEEGDKLEFFVRTTKERKL